MASEPAGGLTPPQYPIESVDNALKILLLLGERKSIRLKDASAYLGVASSTAHRLLAMLQYRGFVRQSSETRAYEPGPALSSVAFALMRRVDVRERAHPVLERLSAAVGETVHLGRLDGPSVFFVDSVESPRTVRVGSRLGMTMPAHCTSTGKALLASLDTEALRKLYPRQKLTALTPTSIVSRDELERELDRVRERGYATSNEESEEGVSSVSTFLGDFSGSRYAINVSAPTPRMPEAIRLEVAGEVLAAADEIKSYFL
ncbi:IclR family transcriptional regulator [Aeromicrobium sp. CTD01-1L150]|uniref:IclR family transcriptional regulator n=1 Tax=Aeromicrobium sp. CTD01-1L150 TaxID=3341830 RepID=UPI0035BF0FE2